MDKADELDAREKFRDLMIKDEANRKLKEEIEK
jgi:hypothetical protein